MDIIKSYLRTFDEFSDAYDRLKDRYQEKVAWYIDALELVTDAEEIYVDGEVLAEPLNDVFELVACRNARMKISEREDF